MKLYAMVSYCLSVGTLSFEKDVKPKLNTQSFDSVIESHNYYYNITGEKIISPSLINSRKWEIHSYHENN